MSEDFKPDSNIFFTNLFKHFDRNEDGFLDEEEFKQLNSFYAESTDKDNTINREITSQFGFLTEMELDEDFNKMDFNNDGKVSYQGKTFFEHRNT